MAEADEASAGRGQFFQLDYAAFRCATALGLNEAVAYLIQATGTGRSNRVSRWSVNSIEHRTGMSRSNANKALTNLQAAGITKKVRGGTFPIYELVPSDEIPGAGAGPFTQEEQLALKAMRKMPLRPIPHALRKAAARLEARGFAVGVNRRDGHYEPKEDAIQNIEPDPEWIWLPNALADGASDETPPIRMLRQGRSVEALRLFVDCYRVHDLPDSGGIPPRYIRQVFDRKLIAQFAIWGFKTGITTKAGREFADPFLTGTAKVYEDGTFDTGWREESGFWPTWNYLVSTGLVQWTAAIFEGTDPTAELVHPFGLDDGSEPQEVALAEALHHAALMLLPESRYRWAKEWAENHKLHLVPIPGHIKEATMVGIARLRYRPRTAKTGAWFAKPQQHASDGLQAVCALTGTPEPARRGNVVKFGTRSS